MKRKCLSWLVAFLTLALMTGCATLPPAPAKDLNPMLRSGERVQKVNNFEVIVDSSASMVAPNSWMQTCVADQLPGSPQFPLSMQTTKLDYEQFLVWLFNDTIPNLKLTAGLRDFAGEHWMGRTVETTLWYGMVPWVKKDFDTAAKKINTYGVESPLDKALDAATMDLKPLAGKSAVIVFSDGLDMPKAPASAQAMKAALGDNVCIYAVQIGSEPQGKALLDQVVKAGACGTLVNAKDVESPEGMAAFVERIFLGPGPAQAMPAAAAPAPAMMPPGMAEKLDAIYFEFDKYNIKPEFRDVLKKNSDWLKANKDYMVRIEGNCDERGTSEYNMALGQRRADSAMKFLISQGIGKDRIGTVSYGKEKPLCTEQEESCWSKNRRDDFVISKP
ncbi:MAG TPA: peptidoglycan-associated lipoprotein Pal [Syntrophales bacterium]|nr:peptidoglycan-associated lipoprotein Pal [Syntrophales bacterium]